MKHGKHNVILIDWWKMQSILGVPIPYNMLFDDVARVGNHVAKLISFLESQGLDANTTTLIGHSLGAHVMGIAGDKAKNKVNHIIGKNKFFISKMIFLNFFITLSIFNP